MAAGFAIPRPAICGAEPCTGSKMPGPSSAERRRSGEPEAARHGRGDVGEDVAEGVLRHDGVDRLGRLHDLHREGVDERVVELDLRIEARPHRGDDVAPQPRGVHDVDLVDRGQPPAARLRRSRSRGARSARPRAASTRTCRTRCRPRGCPSRRSRGRRRAPGRSSCRSRCRARAGGSRRRRAPCAGRAAPARAAPACPRAPAGRRRRGARRRRRGRRRASRRAAAFPGRGSRCRRTRARSASIPSASSTRIASAATSGPIPSPGRTATCVIARHPCDDFVTRIARRAAIVGRRAARGLVTNCHKRSRLRAATL